MGEISPETARTIRGIRNACVPSFGFWVVVAVVLWVIL